jgi:RimJ/RimL family protein N-acetyltransferase
MKNPVFKIQIDDITIRCAEVSDVKAQKEAIECSLEHLHEFMPWSHHEPEPIIKKEERLTRWKNDYLENKDYAFVIFRNKKLIACAGLHTRLGDNALEIGYWVRADEINKNVATKVSLALSYVALNFIKVERVEIRHDIKNLASSKIPLKLKYKRLENYIDSIDHSENGRWIINKSLLEENKFYLESLFEDISFYDIDGNELNE